MIAHYKKLKSNTKSLIVCVICALAPLWAAFPQLSFLDLTLLGYYLPSQMVVMIVLCPILLFSGRVSLHSKRRLPVALVGQAKYFSLFAIFLLISGLVSSNEYTNLSVVVQWVWLIVPFAFACSIVSFAYRSGINTQEFLTGICWGFCIYGLIIVAYNQYSFHIFTTRDRLYAPGMGNVILGYTYALLLALLYYLKIKGFNKKLIVVFSIVFFLVVFLTQSRASLAIAFVLLILCLIPQKNAALGILLATGTLILVIVCNPIDFLLGYTDRLSTLDSNRFITWQNLLSCYADSDLFTKFFGYGFGDVFPYQSWSASLNLGGIERGYTDGAWNSFSFRGYSMLVEPHNAYLWFLLESGAIGLIFFIGYFVYLVHSTPVFKKESDKHLHFVKFVMIASFLVLNAFDATVLVNSAASIWWQFLLLTTVIPYSNSSYDDRVSCDNN